MFSIINGGRTKINGGKGDSGIQKEISNGKNMVKAEQVA